MRLQTEKETESLESLLAKANAEALAEKQSPAPNAITEGMTDDELRGMAREKLSALLQTINGSSHPSLLLSVCREVMDRIEGKSIQRVEAKVSAQVTVSHEQRVIEARKEAQEMLAAIDARLGITIEHDTIPSSATPVDKSKDENNI